MRNERKTDRARLLEARRSVRALQAGLFSTTEELGRYRRHCENLQRSLNVAAVQEHNERTQRLALQARVRMHAEAQARMVHYDARICTWRTLARVIWDRACLAAGRLAP